MPNMDWSRLNKQQLGRYAEYYAKMEFASYGYEIFSTEVDDRGVDFIAKMNGKYYEVQVKSLRESNSMYVFMHKSKMDEHSDSMLVCLLLFFPGRLPEIYVIPATTWQNPNSVFVSRDYGKEGQTSKPEWGIQYSKKNKHLLEQHGMEKYVEQFIGNNTGTEGNR